MPQAVVGAIGYAASYAASAGAISGLAAGIIQTPLIIGSMPFTNFNTPHPAKERTNVDRQSLA